MKTTRIILHRDRGIVILRERTYFKTFTAWDSYIKHPDVLRGWEIRALQNMGVDVK